jgi:uroporphyrinogen III methyltransferase / synthase
MNQETAPTRPLAGRRILVTRPRAQAPALVERLEAAGASVLAVPTIAIEPPESWVPLDRALDRLGDYRWAVFTSANGVLMVRQRLAERGVSPTALSGLRIAAIGPATAEALRACGLGPDVVPEEYIAEGLAARLRALIRAGDRVLLPRAAETRDVLVRELGAMGARVEEVAAYRTGPAAGASELRAALAEGGVDMVTFTSSSAVRYFAALFPSGELRPTMAGVAVACIGPVTAEAAVGLGLRPTVIADEYTIPALARAIIRYYGPEGGSRPIRDAAGPEAHKSATRS